MKIAIGLILISFLFGNLAGCTSISRTQSSTVAKTSKAVVTSGLKANAVIVFAGDSITDGGRNLDDNLSLGVNHPKLFADYMKSNFPSEKITIYNTGVRGDTLLDFYFRMDEDCINLKPDYIVLEIGVNDAWNLYKDKATFEKTYKALLDTLTSKTTAKIILVEPFLLPANEAMKKVCPIENIDNYHTAVNEMIDSVRKVAAEKKLPLIYFSEILEQTHKAGATYQSLSSDSIHLTRMASEILLDQILQKLNIKGYQAKYEFDFTAIDSKYSQYN